MADEGITYEWTVVSKVDGVEVAMRKIEAASDATSKLGEVTDKAEAASGKFGGAAHEAGEHVKGMGDGLDKLGKAHDGAHRKLKEHEEGFKGIGKTISEAKSSMHEFFEFTGASLLADGIESIIDKVKELGSEILHAAAHGERLEKVLEVSYGKEEAEQILSYAKKFAKNSEFTTGEAKSYLIELRKSGVPLKELDVAMAAAGDLASRAEDKSVGMGGAIFGIARAYRTGHIDARSLNRMGVTPEMLRQMPEYAGKTDEQLHEVLHGSKGAPFTVPKMYQAIAGKDGFVGDKGIQMVDLMSNKLDKLAQLPHRLYDAFNKSTAFEALKGKIDHILEVFDPESPGGQKIIAGIGEVGLAIVDMIGKIDFDAVAKSIKDDVIPAITKMVSLIAPMMAIVNQMLDGFKFVHKLMADDEATKADKARKEVKTAEGLTLTGGKSVSSGLFDPLGNILMHIVGIKTKGMHYHHEGGAEDSPEEKAKLKEIFGARGEDAVAGYSEALVPGIEKVSSEAAEKGTEAFSSSIEAHSPSEVYRRLGRHTAAGYALGINDGAASIERAMMDSAVMLPITPHGRSSRHVGNVSLGGIHVTVEGGHKSGHEIGQAVASAIRDLVPPMLIDALEGMSLEGGAA